MDDASSEQKLRNIRVAFGGRLEAARRHYGTQTGRPQLSRTDFAEDLGVQAARYRRYERGETEPPLLMLEKIRRLTGVSLDWLIAGQAQGSDAKMATPHRNVTIGERLRWARETQEPWVPSVAAVMQVTAEQWRAYEENREPLPIETAIEFAHRFSVSLDFLLAGDLKGVAAPVLSALLQAHPELAPNGPQRPAAQPAPEPLAKPPPTPPAAAGRSHKRRARDGDSIGQPTMAASD